VVLHVDVVFGVGGVGRALEIGELSFVVVGVEDVLELFVVGVRLASPASVELDVAFGAGFAPALVGLIIKFGLQIHQIFPGEVLGLFDFGGIEEFDGGGFSRADDGVVLVGLGCFLAGGVFERGLGLVLLVFGVVAGAAHHFDFVSDQFLH
jgi:hypothetical protein